MDYRVNKKGKEAEYKSSSSGNILAFMKEEHRGVVNPAEIAYEFTISEAEAKNILDSLARAGYVDKISDDKVM